jgi:hypothetical protein
MPTQSSTPPAPLQQITLTEDDLKDPGLGLVNNQFTNLVQMVNYLLGHAGVPTLKSGANFNGQPLSNVGEPQSDGDVVTQGFAKSNYGAAALAPQFQALGKQVLQSYRRVNDRVQQERYSTFLNSALTVSPTSNTSTISFGSLGAGVVPVTISGGYHYLMDGSQIAYAAYNDSLVVPSTYSISGTLTRSGGVVSGATTAANGFTPGETVAVAGAGDSTFGGQFVLVTAVSPNFTYNQVAPNATTTGGTVSTAGVYYYSRRNSQNVLFRTGPFAVDSWVNRVASGLDGSTVIAVAVVNGGGGDYTNSAGGGTPPPTNQGAAPRLFGRL